MYNIHHFLSRGRFLVAICLLLVVIHLLLGFYLPVHYDELGWNSYNDRAIQDGFVVHTIYPQCNTLEAGTFLLPISWYPHSIINHFLMKASDNLRWVRIIGMARYVLILGAFYFIALALGKRLAIAPLAIFLAFFGFVSLDAMPLLLQITRPEQTLLLGTFTLMALALNSEEWKHTRLIRYAAIPLMMVAISCMFPAHPKSIALLPVIGWCVYRIIHTLCSRKYLACFVVMMVTAFALQSFYLFIQRSACPLSDTVRQFMNSHSISPDMIAHHFGLFLKALLIIPVEFLLQDNVPTYFRIWLPPILWEVSPVIEYVIMASIWMVVLLRFALIGSVIRLLIRKLQHAFYGSISEQKEKNLSVIAGLLFLSLTVLIYSTGIGREFHLATLELPLLFLGWMLLAASVGEKKYESLLSGKSLSAKTIICIVILSNLCLLLRYYPLLTTAGVGELALESNTYKRQLMFDAIETENRKKDVLEVYKQCGFPIQDQVSHLTLDMAFYPYFSHTEKPYIYSDFSDSFILGAEVAKT